jgi:hypothetical protein
MTFVERTMRFRFVGARGFAGTSSGVIQVYRLRAVASIQAFQRRLGVSAQVRIWGLSLAQMNAYSSRISAGVGLDEFYLIVEAGDVGAQFHKVMEGFIWRSYIDLSGAPESSFNVTVASTSYNAAKPMAAQSWPGAQNAEALIAPVCAVSGLTLHNNGAHAVLRNMNTSGSAIDQISDIARAAKFSLYFSGPEVWIWPFGAPRDPTVVKSEIDERVGYPEWWEAGIVVRQMFDPQIQVGRQMKVRATIPKANGLWQIVQVQPDLSTMLRGGPWFTTAVLSPIGDA